jgi:carbon storage regulator
MLVLGRHRDEIVMIGDDIEVKVTDIRGDKVRLGITAPLNVPVHRKEIYEAIMKDKEKGLTPRTRLSEPKTFEISPGINYNLPPGIRNALIIKDKDSYQALVPQTNCFRLDSLNEQGGIVSSSFMTTEQYADYVSKLAAEQNDNARNKKETSKLVLYLRR